MWSKIFVYVFDSWYDLFFNEPTHTLIFEAYYRP